MRKILFRGKDVKENWHIGFLAKSGNGWYISNSAGIPLAYEVIPSTVGQYTGLTDKNGKKIFEGDIVKYKNSSPCKIAYIDSQFVMMWKNFYRKFERVYDDEIEVIGNIHDNPELLEVQQ